VYTLLWVLKNLIVLPVIEPTEYTDYASLVMYQMTGMYPTLIIILVALKKLHIENQFPSYGGVTTRNQDIAFKPGRDPAWSPGFTNSCGESDIIVSSRMIKISGQDSQTDVASKDGEKSDHGPVGADSVDIYA